MSDLKPLTIEWVDTRDLEPVNPHGIPRLKPIVRLEQVDALMAEAVWAMEVASAYLGKSLERISSQSELIGADYKRAQAFLASEAVQAWRKRQEKEKCKCGYPHGPGGE